MTAPIRVRGRSRHARQAPRIPSAPRKDFASALSERLGAACDHIRTVGLVLATLLIFPSFAVCPSAQAEPPAGAEVSPPAAQSSREARLARGAMAKFRFAAGRPATPEAAFIIDGVPRSLSEFRGRMVLLNVWASWCQPCRTEMPALSRLGTRLAADGLVIVAVSIDKNLADAERFLSALGLRDLPLYHDPSSTSLKKLGAVGVPTSILIDRQGREIGRLRGSAAWDSDEAILLIRGALHDEQERDR